MTNFHEAETSKDWAAHLFDVLHTFKHWVNPPDDWTIPFVPWRGGDYENTRPRLMFVGKSAGLFDGWTSKLSEWRISESPDAEILTTTYVAERLTRFQPHTPAFWLKPYLIAGALLSTEIDRGRLVHCIAWTNLYKVNSLATNNGVPHKADLECTCRTSNCLLHVSTRWLKQEMEILKPDVVLIGAGDHWNIFRQGLGLGNSYNTELPLRLDTASLNCMELRHRPIGIWITNHFSAWTHGKKNCLHGAIMLDIRRALSGL